MKKIVDFLEAYVQWVAIGLGLLWVIWIAYAYWLASPVTVEYSGQKLTPGAVSQTVDEGVASRLQGAIEEPLPPELKNIKIDDQLKRFHKNLEISMVPPQLLGNGGLGGTIDTNNPDFLKPQIKVATLPSLDGVVVLYPPVATGMSLVEVGVAGDKGAKKTEGKIWATVSAQFLHDAFVAAWTAAQLPPKAQATFFLRVQLVREENINGEWTDSKVIRELPIKGHELPGWVNDKSMPATSTKDYDLFAGKNCELIIRPPFYPWASAPASDKWRSASMPVPPPLVIPTRKFLPGTKMTPINAQEREMEDLWQQEHKPKPPPVVRPPSVGNPQPPPPPPVHRTQPVTPPKPPVKPPIPTPVTPTPTPSAATMGSHPTEVKPPVKVVLPNGLFVPSQIQDLEIWAHDDTVEPGHAYRYKIRLSMRNPLYNTVNVAADPKDTKIYAITTETDWSELVLIPSTSYFYFTKDGGAGLANARPEALVYTWKDGNWSVSDPMKIEPGDPIGQTGCTLVDTRLVHYHNTNQVNVVVREANGLLVSRTVKGDQADENRKRLDMLVQQAAADLLKTPTGH